MAHTCDVFSGSQESYTNLMVDCTNEYISVRRNNDGSSGIWGHSGLTLLIWYDMIILNVLKGILHPLHGLPIPESTAE